MELFLGPVQCKRTVCVSSGKQSPDNCKFVGQGVVRIKIEVFVCVGPLSVDSGGQGAIRMVCD